MAQEINPVKSSGDIVTETPDTYYYAPEYTMTTVDPPRLSLLKRVQNTLTTREGLLGDYDYGALCMPRIPFYTKRVGKSIFYGPDDSIPVLVALLMGVQRK